MKTLIFSIIVILYSIQVYSQELNGYSLGSKHEGKKILMTTLSGVEGVFVIETLNDGTIYTLIFNPSDGETITRISKSLVEKLIRGLEEDYNAEFKITDIENSSRYYVRSTNTGNLDILIIVESDENLKPSERFTIYFTDLILKKEKEKDTVNQ